VGGGADHNKKGHHKYIASMAEQIANNILGENEEIDIPSIVEVTFVVCKYGICFNFLYSGMQ
jgi:hypothetical protein